MFVLKRSEYVRRLEVDYICNKSRLVKNKSVVCRKQFYSEKHPDQNDKGNNKNIEMRLKKLNRFKIYFFRSIHLKGIIIQKPACTKIIYKTKPGFF